MEVEDESVFHFIFLNLVITWFVARLEFSEKLTDKILITKCFFFKVIYCNQGLIWFIFQWLMH